MLEIWPVELSGQTETLPPQERLDSQVIRKEYTSSFHLLRDHASLVHLDQLEKPFTSFLERFRLDTLSRLMISGIFMSKGIDLVFVQINLLLSLLIGCTYMSNHLKIVNGCLSLKQSVQLAGLLSL